jgi:hypothetical protein
MISPHFKSRDGYVALTTILIVASVTLIIAVGLSLRSIGESQMSFAEESSHRALALANLCAEKALMKLEDTFNYSGSESINIGENSCDILSIEGSGNTNRIVKTQSTVSNHTRKVKLEVAVVSPIMEITSWREVADF